MATSTSVPPTATPNRTPTGTVTNTATATGTPTNTATATSTPSSTPPMRTITYTYDGLQRLIGAVESPGSSYAYQYDVAGNRTDVTTNGTLTQHRAYDAANQLQSGTYSCNGDGTLVGLPAGGMATSYAQDLPGRQPGARVRVLTAGGQQPAQTPYSTPLWRSHATKPSGTAMVERRLWRTSAHSSNWPVPLISARVTGSVKVPM